MQPFIINYPADSLRGVDLISWCAPPSSELCLPVLKLLVVHLCPFKTTHSSCVTHLVQVINTNFIIIEFLQPALDEDVIVIIEISCLSW